MARAALDFDTTIDSPGFPSKDCQQVSIVNDIETIERHVDVATSCSRNNIETAHFARRSAPTDVIVIINTAGHSLISFSAEARKKNEDAWKPTTPSKRYVGVVPRADCHAFLRYSCDVISYFLILWFLVFFFFLLQ